MGDLKLVRRKGITYIMGIKFPLDPKYIMGIEVP